jgi:hypothetical protein
MVSLIVIDGYGITSVMVSTLADAKLQMILFESATRTSKDFRMTLVLLISSFSLVIKKMCKLSIFKKMSSITKIR